MIFQVCGLLLLFQGFDLALGQITDHPNWKYLNPEGCGISAAKRIVEGRPALPGEFPWMVQIRNTFHYHDGTTLNTILKNCSGTILNRNYILTAAHCFHDQGEYVETSIQSPDCPADPSAEFEVFLYRAVVVTEHPHYEHASGGYDIALVRTDPVIHLADGKHVPICLEHDELLEEDYAGQWADVAGWGASLFADPYNIEDPVDRAEYSCSVDLQVQTVPIMDKEKCVEAIQKIKEDNFSPEIQALPTILDSHICAGGEPEKFVYYGDSGGPLMLVRQVGDFPARTYQIGIVSYGDVALKNVEYTTPAVYTRVRYYLPWILDNLAGDS